MKTFAKDDKVQIIAEADPKWAGKVGTVEKVNRTTVDVVLSTGHRMRVEPYWLTPFEGEVADAPEAFVCGETVRFVSEQGMARFPGLYVVIRDSGDKVKVARLGGDADRVVTAPSDSFAKVPLSEILKDGVQ